MDTQRLTVCVADIERFNVATRNMSLDQLVAFLQGYYEHVGGVLLSHNGRLVKYMRDAVLATFEAGREEVAARAMWALAAAYAEYAAAISSDAAISRLSVGIATGEVAVGQMGHPQMLCYDVLGRTVTVAHALLNCGGVVLDTATHSAIANRVQGEVVDHGGDIRGFRVTGFR
jgi:adenylate cyclase